jgi:hypothetical protein
MGDPVPTNDARVILVDTSVWIEHLRIGDPQLSPRLQHAHVLAHSVKSLNALLAIVSTPTSAPVIVATRLRRGGTNSARGAARLVADALVTTKACGGSGLVTVRTDSAYYGHDVIAAASRGGARFSITVRMNRTVVTAISAIKESAWTPIHPNAIWDEDEQRLVSDAEVAKVAFIASHPAARPTTSVPG